MGNVAKALFGGVASLIGGGDSPSAPTAAAPTPLPSPAPMADEDAIKKAAKKKAARLTGSGSRVRSILSSEDAGDTLG